MSSAKLSWTLVKRRFSAPLKRTMMNIMIGNGMNANSVIHGFTIVLMMTSVMVMRAMASTIIMVPRMMELRTALKSLVESAITLPTLFLKKYWMDSRVRWANRSSRPLWVVRVHDLQQEIARQEAESEGESRQDQDEDAAMDHALHPVALYAEAVHDLPRDERHELLAHDEPDQEHDAPRVHEPSLLQKPSQEYVLEQNRSLSFYMVRCRFVTRRRELKTPRRCGI